MPEPAVVCVACSAKHRPAWLLSSRQPVRDLSGRPTPTVCPNHPGDVLRRSAAIRAAASPSPRTLSAPVTPRPGRPRSWPQRLGARAAQQASRSRRAAPRRSRRRRPGHPLDAYDGWSSTRPDRDWSDTVARPPESLKLDHARQAVALRPEERIDVAYRGALGTTSTSPIDAVDTSSANNAEGAQRSVATPPSPAAPNYAPCRRTMPRRRSSWLLVFVSNVNAIPVGHDREAMDATVAMAPLLRTSLRSPRRAVR
jgi:hypothetical protein